MRQHRNFCRPMSSLPFSYKSLCMRLWFVRIVCQSPVFFPFFVLPFHFILLHLKWSTWENCQKTAIDNKMLDEGWTNMRKGHPIKPFMINSKNNRSTNALNSIDIVIVIRQNAFHFIWASKQNRKMRNKIACSHLFGRCDLVIHSFIAFSW